MMRLPRIQMSWKIVQTWRYVDEAQDLLVEFVVVASTNLLS